jgi:hypothetical protein
MPTTAIAVAASGSTISTVADAGTASGRGKGILQRLAGHPTGSAPNRQGDAQTEAPKPVAMYEVALICIA